jgi:methyl-accepting chemotaxis protein PixJ
VRSLKNLKLGGDSLKTSQLNMRQAPDLDALLKITVAQIREKIGYDRVAVYRLNPNWSGEFVAESAGHLWVKLVGPDIKTVWEDTHLQETQGGRYAQGENFVVNDIYQVGHSPCHIEVLEQLVDQLLTPNSSHPTL